MDRWKSGVVGNEKETPISYHLYDKINFIHILTRDIYISVSRQVYAQASNLLIHELPIHTHRFTHVFQVFKLRTIIP